MEYICRYPVVDLNGSHESTLFDPMGLGHRECGDLADVKMYGFFYCKAHAEEVKNQSGAK